VFTLFGYLLALSPPQLAALALAAVGVLAAAHLVGRRRRRVVVSTVDSWTPSRRPAHRLRLGWRIRRWLLFLLQVAIAILLVLALADPRPDAAGGRGRSVVLLVDTSASMGAAAGDRTRLELARRRALAIAGRLGPDDEILVAGFAGQLQIESGWTRDRAAIEAALARLAVGTEAQDLLGAVAAASGLARDRGRPGIVAIGDRPAGEAGLPAGGVPIEYLPVGGPVENVGIVGLGLQRAADDPSRTEAWVMLQASGQRAGRARVELMSSRSGRRIGAAQVDLPARGRLAVKVPLSDATEDAVVALLREPVPGPQNQLQADDLARATLRAAPRRRILLVSQGNLYLEGALRSFGTELSVERRAPSQLPSGQLDFQGYDVVVFDGVATGPGPGFGRFLYLDPSGPESPFPSRGQVRDPVPTELRRDHPLLRHLSLADLNIREARRLTVDRDDVVVAAALGVPLIVAREKAGLRSVAIGFDLRRSDLPLRPTLPLLLANTIDWLAGSSGQPPIESTGALLDPREADTLDAAEAGTVDRAPSAPAGLPFGSRLRSHLVELLCVLALALGLVEWWLHQRRGMG
jgi:Ca-activated chloride channel homolog